jgi:hypothetical protein
MLHLRLQVGGHDARGRRRDDSVGCRRGFDLGVHRLLDVEAFGHRFYDQFGAGHGQGDAVAKGEATFATTRCAG